VQRFGLESGDSRLVAANLDQGLDRHSAVRGGASFLSLGHGSLGDRSPAALGPTFPERRASRKLLRPMALTIVIRSGDTRTRAQITFDAPRVVIGRGDGCEVRLPDPSVSHRHASIRQRGSEYVLIDEGSSNGTFVGPVRLSAQAPRVIRHQE